MNNYIIRATPDNAGDEAAYAIGHMYVRWAARYNIPAKFNCHPTIRGRFTLEIGADLSCEVGIHRYCWVPEYPECRGLRYTIFVYMTDSAVKGTLTLAPQHLNSFVLTPFLVARREGTEYTGSQVYKILDGKIPWLKHLRGSR